MKQWLKNFSKQFQHPTGFWGHVAGKIMAFTTRSRNQWTLSFLEIQENDRVLEIGYGPGVGIELCSHQVQQGQIVGIDISDAMYQQAWRRNRKAIETGKVELRIASIEDLPLSEEPFDKIYTVNSVMFWPDQQAAFQKLYALLTPEGTLAITYQPMHKGATKEDAIHYAERLKMNLEQVGFTDVAIATKDFRPITAACVVAHKKEST